MRTPKIAAVSGYTLARTLHIGILAGCFFDPASALCLKTTADQTKPQTGLCQLAKCPNACIHAPHLSAWQKAEEETKALLKERRLTVIQLASPKAERERIRDVIEEVTGS